ncbi:hypothetical protein AD18_0621 [Escherichia coli 3-475-03_S4_C2]|uniref:Uncharacterized protein n=1 Tax=Shigella boydii 4444-74 TaxID=766140 RepID=I6F633_SHIBO|nr:hypothetical protein PCN061_0135 [Escherichia coli PCN061]EFQ02843.1 hypothetical protein EC182770_0716 [Escherichia coli 1827-70]EIQ51725.1 hypothetical protein SB444474_5430 [Shigella boydii 4444-74]EMW91457.1 hypothetical protein EC180050_0123 [Escherichia coli 180050]EMX92057.1 hypothetical protein EC2719100_0297 [Escherichia coli 2719100]ENA42697.1 hypothetical protein ECP03018674_0200 [Escherichia coli P0301867.4]ENH01015.1 hypothetical protein ECP03018673_0200 [Escherichia coli P030
MWLKIEFNLRLCGLQIITRNDVDSKILTASVIRIWGYIVRKIVQCHGAEINYTIIIYFDLTCA